MQLNYYFKNFIIELQQLHLKAAELSRQSNLSDTDRRRVRNIARRIDAEIERFFDFQHLLRRLEGPRFVPILVPPTSLILDSGANFHHYLDSITTVDFNEFYTLAPDDRASYILDVPEAFIHFSPRRQPITTTSTEELELIINNNGPV